MSETDDSKGPDPRLDLLERTTALLGEAVGVASARRVKAEQALGRLNEALRVLYWTVVADGDDPLQWTCCCGEDPEDDALHGGHCPFCRLMASGLTYLVAERPKPNRLPPRRATLDWVLSLIDGLRPCGRGRDGYRAALDDLAGYLR